MNRDSFASLPVVDAARATMAVIDVLQSKAPEQQLAGLASCFLLACEHHGIAPQDAFAFTTNIMNHADGRRPEFQAVRAFMEGEWRR